jgi:hypothetical protein
MEPTARRASRAGNRSDIDAGKFVDIALPGLAHELTR